MPFNPSGTSGLDEAASGVDDSASRNHTETDISTVVSDHDKKVVYLSEMFPSVDSFTIHHTLKKCDQDVERGMDILLNLSFLHRLQLGKDDDQIDVTIRKGVDGFEQASDDDGIAGKQRRKKKKKGRGGKNEQSPAPSTPAKDGRNRWDIGKQDVDFICSRTHVKRETVASVYHANGGSLSATVRALANANAPLDERGIVDEPVLAAHVAELTQGFSSVPLTTLAGLLRITNNSLPFTDQLAPLLMKHDSSPVPASLSGIFKIATPPIAPDDGEAPEQGTSSTSSTPKDYNQARRTLNSHSLTSADAFSKASAAYRRGKSDRLMGGAAAYYSGVGRDHQEKAKREASVAADLLVDAQSTSDMLDLHGVSAHDAVRIALSKVEEWWESQGDEKYVRGRPTRPGYHIVIGAGRHSRDGTSRLGPAVERALAREGWRFEAQEGVLIVVGVVRRR